MKEKRKGKKKEKIKKGIQKSKIVKERRGMNK